MADIDVFQTVTSVSFEVEPNTNVININKITTTGYSGVPSLQDVTDVGASTTNPITANSFVKSGGTGANVLLDNGSTTLLTSIVGTTNLTYTSGVSNGIVNSNTGTDATIPLADSTNAGLFSATEKTKLSGIASGAEVNVNADWNAVSGDAEILNKPTIPSITGLATTTYVDNKDNSQQLQLNYLDRDNSIFDAFYLRTIADGGTVEASNQLLSSLAVLRNISYVNQGYTQQINADKFVKLGGAADEYLMADGSISTGGGGGGGATNLTTTQTISNFTINSDTGTDATIPLGNGTLAGGTLNNYTTTEKNKLAAITGTNTGDQNLQSVTTLGANTTNPIGVSGVGASNAITGQSGTGTGVLGISDGGTGIDGSSNTGIGVYGYSEFGVAAQFETDGTANIANFKSSGSIVASFNNAGELTAQKLKKDGGTSAQILAADGSVITAGNNITITGGQISSVGGTGGGGSSVNYYLNGGTSQGTFGGTTYYEFSKTAVVGTGVDFNISSNGYIASFITDVADPSLLLIPGGNWNLEFYFSSSSAGGSPSFYVELYKYDGTTFTSIASSSATPEGITNGTSIDAYFTSLAVPETILTVNDRLAIRVFVNASSKTITLHTQNSHLCQVITTFTSGLTALNGLQAQVQNFATGTTGTDFAINSSGSTHTFNLPSASATARGVVTTVSQTFAGIKTFGSSPKIPTNPANGTTAGVVIDDGTGTIQAGSLMGYPSGTELTYVKGVTSSIQTQLNYDASAIQRGAVTTGTQTFAGSKTFSSAIKIPANPTNSAGAIVIDSDGLGNIVPASNLTYPNLTELTYVKGVTSSIQTQFSGKQDTLVSTANIKSINGNSLLGAGNLTISATTPSQSAFTVLANNTNASAVPTEQVFKEVAEQAYAGATPTWTGLTAPSGTTNHSYQWSQIGKIVNLRVNLDYATAGSSLTAVNFDLPSDCPPPKLPAGVSANGDVICYGSGMLTTTRTSVATPTANAVSLRIKGTGTYEINVIRASATGHKYAYATIQYFAQ